MKKLPTPYAKARTEARSWAYRFDEDETAPFVCPSLDDESDIIPGTVCRNTCRLSDVEYDRLIRAKKQKTKKKDKEYQ